jgi:hypothetical protein
VENVESIELRSICVDGRQVGMKAIDICMDIETTLGGDANGPLYGQEIAAGGSDQP